MKQFEEGDYYAPAVKYRFSGIAEDLQRLDQLLTDVAALVPWPNFGNEVTVVNLACGRADETGVLWKHFFRKNQRAWYFGCDLRQAEIQEARGRWKSPLGVDWHIDFRVGDAANTSHLPERASTRGIADVIFIRHQNFWDAPAVWDRIFNNAKHLLRDNGRLVITSYFDREHELALASLKTNGFTLLVDVPHHAGRMLHDAPGKFVDRKIAVLCRGE